MKTIAEMNLVITSLAEAEVLNTDNLAYFNITATTLNGDTYELCVEDYKVVKIVKFDEAC